MPFIASQRGSSTLNVMISCFSAWLAIVYRSRGLIHRITTPPGFVYPLLEKSDTGRVRETHEFAVPMPVKLEVTPMSAQYSKRWTLVQEALLVALSVLCVVFGGVSTVRGESLASSLWVYVGLLGFIVQGLMLKTTSEWPS